MSDLEWLYERYKNSLRMCRFLDATKRMHIKIKLVNEIPPVFTLIKGKAFFHVYKNQLVRSGPSGLLTKNKNIVKNILKSNIITVPKSVDYKYNLSLKEVFRESGLQYPVVVKPIDSSKGYGVVLGVNGYKDLKKAVKYSFSVINKLETHNLNSVLIEEQFEGNDYRVLVLDGKVIACAERVPAYVVGDGRTRVFGLIEKFNEKRPDGYKLTVDKPLKKLLREQKLSLRSIINKGQIAKLRKIANISLGGRVINRTGDISKRFINISIKATNALGLSFCGIDIITQDISSNSNEQRYCVLEINSKPDYDLHEKPIDPNSNLDTSVLLIRKMFSN